MTVLMFVDIKPSKHSDYGKAIFRRGRFGRREYELSAKNYWLLRDSKADMELLTDGFGVTLYPARARKVTK